MGLLDSLNSRDGIFALGLLSAAAPRPVRSSIGGGLLAALQGANAWQNEQEDRASAAEERKRRAELQALQMQQMKDAAEEQRRQREQSRTDEALLRQQFTPLPGPTQDGSELMPRADPAGMLGRGASPQAVTQLLALQQAMQKPAQHLMKVSPGEQVFDTSRPGDGPLFGVQATPKEATPTELSRLLSEMQSLPPGSPARALYEQQIRKLTTHAPGTSVNINTAKPFLETVAGGLGKQLDEGLASARSAAQSITTAHTLRRAAESGRLAAGPSANFQVFGMQIGQMLGVGGRDTNERLLNTRTAIQAMAKAEVDAAQLMRGQGQITESERDIIRRAASGNIQDMTAPELSLLAQTMEKTARAKISAHHDSLRKLSMMPAASAIIPFYQVEMPAAYQPTSVAPGTGGGGWGIRPIPPGK